jgi:hypothetical protein
MSLTNFYLVEDEESSASNMDAMAVGKEEEVSAVVFSEGV